MGYSKREIKRDIAESGSYLRILYKKFVREKAKGKGTSDETPSYPTSFSGRAKTHKRAASQKRKKMLQLKTLDENQYALAREMGARGVASCKYKRNTENY